MIHYHLQGYLWFADETQHIETAVLGCLKNYVGCGLPHISKFKDSNNRKGEFDLIAYKFIIFYTIFFNILWIF